MDQLLCACYASLAFLNLWLSITGLSHARALARTEQAPILGEPDEPHARAAALAAFLLAGTLNLAAGTWVAVQAWSAVGLTIFAAAVAGALILAGAVNLAAARAVLGRGGGREGRSRLVGTAAAYYAIGRREKC
ncbi:hypothetical protein HDZ31DRAFT_74772 [Schizophyllum fasciatum]